MTRLPRILGLALVTALLLPAGQSSAEPIKSVHATLKSPRAQANREEIFRMLMRGDTPSWLRGKSPAEIARRKETIRKSVLTQGRKVVKAIVAKPEGKASKAEQNILGLLSPAQRAQLLKEEAGFKVDPLQTAGQSSTKYKITLKRHGASEYGYGGSEPPELKKQMSIYNRVMAPNVITFMPAGYHSKYVSRGEVFDIWGSNHSTYGGLRPNSYQLYPTWLSDGEAARMSTVIEVGRSSWNSALGTQLAHGRPAMWPPAPGSKAKTGNSCTTTFIRAPIGDRDGRYAWIDELQGKVMKAASAGRVRVQGMDLKENNLLTAITGQSKEKYEAVFADLKRQLPGERQNLDKLKEQVDFFYTKLKGSEGYYSSGPEKCSFPMDLMHRAPLAELAKITGDPVGPKGASQKFRSAGDPLRVGVQTVFEKAPNPPSRW